MEVRQRLKDWGAILAPPWKWVVVAPFALLGAYQAVQQQFAPNLPGALPGSSEIWFILTLLLFCGLLLEGAYRQIRAIRKDAEQREKELVGQLQEAKLISGRMRPRIALGQNTSVSITPDDAKNFAHIVIHPSFRNAGQKPAYHLRLQSGFAAADLPTQFQTWPDLNLVNPINSTEELYPDMQLGTKFVREGKERKVRSTEILVYCGFQYFDSPQDGERYSDEFWFVYPLGRSLGSATLEQKTALEPYVRKAFEQKA